MEISAEEIKEMFDIIASKYDFCNNIISFFTHKTVKSHAIKLLNIMADSKILDLCSGTGDFIKIIQQTCPSCSVIGLDFSEKMVEIAKQKGLNSVLGDAINIQFSDSEFDYVTEGFGLRNVKDRERALREIYRVLKSGGYFLHLDFGKTKLLSMFYNQYVLNIMKIFSHNYFAYEYLIKSIEKFPNSHDLQEEIERNGFKKILIKNVCFGIISIHIYQKIN